MGELRPIANQRIGAAAPAGGVVANVLDMARYVATQLRGGVALDGTRVASAEQVQRTHSVQTETPDNPFFPGEQLGYAMGWGVTDYRGHRLIHHAGGISGYRSEIMLVPDADIAVVVLTNSFFGAYFARSMLFAVIDAHFGYGDESMEQVRAGYERVLGARDQLREGLAPRLDTEAVAPLLGTYERGWRLALEEGGLWLRNAGWSFELLPLTEGGYLTGTGGDVLGLPVQFEEGEDGVISLLIGDLDTVRKQE